MAQTSVIRAFDADHVAQVTGLSQRQLSYWDSTGFFRPQHANEKRTTPYGRIYSFKDVVALRTIAILRKRHKLPLQQLRKVARELGRHEDEPWSNLVLYVFNKEVHFREPGTNRVRGALSKQYVNLPLRTIIEDTAQRANKVKTRSKNQIGRIERHRYVAHNAWVVAGTRIPVRAIVSFSQAGYTPKQIVREYPALTEADVAAALKHTDKLTKAA